MPALILLSLGMSLLASLLHSSVATSEIATSRAERFETRRATGSVNRITAQAIWSMYEATLADGVSVTTGGMRAYLDSQGLVDQSDQTPTPIPVDGWLGLGHNQHGELVLGDSIVDWVRVHREDSGNQTLLYVTSLTHNDVGHHAHTECQTDVFALEPSEFLTPEEIAAAEGAQYPDGLFNPQTQTQVTWPDDLARAAEDSRKGG
ncbi:MAG: hypothetical protein AAFZ87_08290 [Planctomycetota bacterium]